MLLLEEHRAATAREREKKCMKENHRLIGLNFISTRAYLHQVYKIPIKVREREERKRKREKERKKKEKERSIK